MALRFAIFSFLLLAGPGCFLVKGDVASGPQGLPDGGLPPGLGVGGSCSRDGQCRSGLTCAPESHTCQPMGNKVPKSPCVVSAECLPGNWCSAGMCAPKSGQGKEGDPCSAESDCMGSLICNLSGLYGVCAQPGKGDVGAACEQTTDCLGGLVCVGHKCGNLLTIRPWEGARCPDSAEAVSKTYFRVPRPDDTSEDFYRLPYPNDIRKKNGKLSLAGHPKPGARLLTFDPLERYMQAIEEDMTGYGLNQAVFFRFSKDPDLGSLQSAISFHDISAGSPEYGGPIGHSWWASTGGGAYICPRYVVVRHGFGHPLRPGDTYAVIMTSAVTAAGGTPMEADDDFKAMMGDTAPADPALGAAWQAYAPLRKYVADKKLDATKIISAAVFTTEDVELPVAGLRKAVRAAAPALQKLVRCGGGQPSPCEDGKMGDAHTHGCMPLGDAPFDEYQGVLHQPVLQAGKRPYADPQDGGGIAFDGTGAPMSTGMTEDVCVSLTVPRGTPPAGGWPIVVYGHGTGGNYRSHVDLGLAADLAKGELPGGAAAPAAVLGYDGVLHATRRGGATTDPEQLVYNYLNPRAARDNALQAAGDLFALAAAIEAFPADVAPINGKKLALYGHSQGANAAVLAAAFEPAYGATVLSGSGGTTMLGLLGKTKPVDVPALLPVLFGDASVDANHPVLNLLQAFFERADTVNFVRRIAYNPQMGLPARHLFHIYGTQDNYSPVETQRTLAQAAGIPIVGPVIDDYGLATVNAPAKANMASVAGGTVTVVQAQYKPGNYDGHFVSTENPSARRALLQMLGTFFRDGTPTVTP